MSSEFLNLSSASYVFIDVETYDPDLQTKGPSWVRGDGEILYVGIGVDNQIPNTYVWNEEGLYQYLQDLRYFEGEIIGFNVGYDLGWLLHYGVDLLNNKHADAMAGAQVIDNALESYSLDSVCKEWLGKGKIDLSQKYGPDWKNNMRKLEPHDAKLYCNVDIIRTRDLFYHELSKIDQYSIWDAFQLENQLIPITVKMKKQGVPLDLEYIQQLKKTFYEREFKLIQRLKHKTKCWDLNVWSGTSVANLFDKMKVSYPKTTVGKPSFTRDWLDGCSDPIGQDVAAIRKLNKLRSTFLEGLEKLQVNGRVHPDYYAGRDEEGSGTISARFSSAHPNKQQIPTRTEEGALIRECFIAPENTRWICNDYSQQEPRLAVHYAAKLNVGNIAYWVDEYEKNPDSDFYDFITNLAGIKRDDSKTITLARMYGMGAEKCATKLHVEEDKAYRLLERFDKHIPWMKELAMIVASKAEKRGWVKSLFGRRFMYLKDKPYVMFNRLIQGGAAEQTKKAMVTIYREIGLVPTSQVHDELNYFGGEDEARITRMLMKEAVELAIPVKVDTGLARNWGSAKKNPEVVISD